MQRNLTLSKVLELALALGRLVWIAIQAIPALDLKLVLRFEIALTYQTAKGFPE